MLCKIFFKLARDDVSFPSAERSFEALAPLKEKHFWPVFELVLGSLKSVSVFLNQGPFQHEDLYKMWNSYKACAVRMTKLSNSNREYATSRACKKVNNSKQW